MKQRVERYLPQAIEAVKNFGVSDKDGKVDKQYNGYISSIGASVIQSGLLPTVAFFLSNKSSAEKDRRRILKAIYWIVGECEGEIALSTMLIDDNTHDNLNEKLNKKLLTYTNSHQNRDLLLNRLLDAATALKLAIKTFELKTDENK